MRLYITGDRKKERPYWYSEWFDRKLGRECTEDILCQSTRPLAQSSVNVKASGSESV